MPHETSSAVFDASLAPIGLGHHPAIPAVRCAPQDS
jgi:hypothetical protein